jgi:hypothetical protein
MQNISLLTRLGILLAAIAAIYFIVLSFDSSPESAASAWVEAAPRNTSKGTATINGGSCHECPARFQLPRA